MLILAATVCILTDPLTVKCETHAMRIETDRYECLAMLKPVEDMLIEQTTGLPVVYIRAACKVGLVL